MANEKVVLLTIKKKNTTEWNNVVLLSGELGYNTETKEIKIGDGTSKYQDLPAILNKNAVTNLIQEQLAASGSGSGTVDLTLYAKKTDLQDVKTELTVKITTDNTAVKQELNDNINNLRQELNNNINNIQATTIVRTKDEWDNPSTPPLKLGQLGFDATNKTFKIGDGINKFNTIENNIITKNSLEEELKTNKKIINVINDVVQTNFQEKRCYTLEHDFNIQNSDYQAVQFYEYKFLKEVNFPNTMTKFTLNSYFNEYIIDGIKFVKIPKLYYQFDMDITGLKKAYYRFSFNKINESYGQFTLHPAFYHYDTGEEVDYIYVSSDPFVFEKFYNLISGININTSLTNVSTAIDKIKEKKYYTGNPYIENLLHWLYSIYYDTGINPKFNISTFNINHRYVLNFLSGLHFYNPKNKVEELSDVEVNNFTFNTNTGIFNKNLFNLFDIALFYFYNNTAPSNPNNGSQNFNSLKGTARNQNSFYYNYQLTTDYSLNTFIKKIEDLNNASHNLLNTSGNLSFRFYRY